MAESSEGEEEGKLTGGDQQLVVDDDLHEMAKKAAWSVSSCKPGNGVLSLRDDNLDTYWQYINFLSYCPQIECIHDYLANFICLCWEKKMFG